MQQSYYNARANLYYLWQHHPDWGHAQFAAALGSSQGWVKKWLKRFREELAQGMAVETIDHRPFTSTQATSAQNASFGC